MKLRHNITKVCQPVKQGERIPAGNEYFDPEVQKGTTGRKKEISWEHEIFQHISYTLLESGSILYRIAVE